MTTCEQLPIRVIKKQSISQFYQTPLLNCQFYQVLRVAVLHRFDNTSILNVFKFFSNKNFNLGIIVHDILKLNRLCVFLEDVQRKINKPIFNV